MLVPCRETPAIAQDEFPMEASSSLRDPHCTETLQASRQIVVDVVTSEAGDWYGTRVHPVVAYCFVAHWMTVLHLTLEATCRRHLAGARSRCFVAFFLSAWKLAMRALFSS